jgi:hypothetical protein
MFSGCSNLSYIKMMAIELNLLGRSTGGWVTGVAATGTFIKNSAARWSNTPGDNAIPSGWTVQYAS